MKIAFGSEILCVRVLESFYLHSARFTHRAIGRLRERFQIKPPPIESRPQPDMSQSN